MELTDADLVALREMCLNQYSDEQSSIRSIILYGSAAKNYLGQDGSPGDFDLNMFVSDQSTISSTHGMPKIIGEYNGLEVEVMRNRVPDETSVERYVNAQGSKRWDSIKDNPVVRIYPEIERKEWG